MYRSFFSFQAEPWLVVVVVAIWVRDTLSAGIMGDTVIATVATGGVTPLGATLFTPPMTGCAGVQDTGDMTPLLVKEYGYLVDGFHAIKSK